MAWIYCMKCACLGSVERTRGRIKSANLIVSIDVFAGVQLFWVKTTNIFVCALEGRTHVPWIIWLFTPNGYVNSSSSSKYKYSSKTLDSGNNVVETKTDTENDGWLGGRPGSSLCEIINSNFAHHGNKFLSVNYKLMHGTYTRTHIQKQNQFFVKPR